MAKRDARNDEKEIKQIIPPFLSRRSELQRKALIYGSYKDLFNVALESFAYVSEIFLSNFGYDWFCALSLDEFCAIEYGGLPIMILSGAFFCFSTLGEVLTLPGRKIRTQHIAQADLLLVRSITPVSKELLAGSKVQFVATATIGLDHMDVAWLQQHNIGFASAPGCNALLPMADHPSGRHHLCQR